jgi:hypothetical protein
VDEWKVVLEGKIIGVARLYNINQPWFYCKFYPTNEYENVKYLFEEEFKILESEDYDAWNDYYDVISLKGLKLISLSSGQSIEDMLVVHIQLDTAWFRYES